MPALRRPRRAVPAAQVTVALVEIHQAVTAADLASQLVTTSSDVERRRGGPSRPVRALAGPFRRRRARPDRPHPAHLIRLVRRRNPGILSDRRSPVVHRAKPGSAVGSERFLSAVGSSLEA